MIWAILEKKITDAGLAVAGQTLYRFQQPAIPVGVFIKNPLEGITADIYIPGFYARASVQIIVRHTDPVEGLALANAVVACVSERGMREYEAIEDSPAMRIHYFFPKSLPIQFPRLDGGGIEWSLNFRTAFAAL